MLDISHISKTFNPGMITEKVALIDVSLHLAPGEFVTVIGGNGAGKSTLMNSIAGTFPVDKGTISIDDEDITDWPEHRRAKYIGRVFQDPMMGTAANMMIEENLEIASRRNRRPNLSWSSKKEDKEKFQSMLASLHLGLEDRLESKVGLLSGGQRQALTLLIKITTSIVAERHLTTLMITHNMRDALACGNRLIMMYGGKILIDVKDREKKKLTVKDLLLMFEKAAGSELGDDSLLLS